MSGKNSRYAGFRNCDSKAGHRKFGTFLGTGRAQFNGRSSLRRNCEPGKNQSYASPTLSGCGHYHSRFAAPRRFRTYSSFDYKTSKSFHGCDKNSRSASQKSKKPPLRSHGSSLF